MKIHTFFGILVVFCYVNSIESTIPGLRLGSGGGGSGSGNLLRSIIQGFAGRPGVEGEGAPLDASDGGDSSDVTGDALR
jgi:hypothetical protein